MPWHVTRVGAMIIDRLILNNFKRFRHQEIQFKDGITGILGSNGTGKSSIVEAIFFALYGVQATGIQPDYIVSSFAGPKEKSEVRLDFRVGGDEYSVLRTFKKGKTVQHDASFYRAGKLRATGVSQVAVEMERTLGMGPADFRNTVYAGQKDLLTLLENTPGKRKEWFLRALGIDYLKTESDRLMKERIDARERDLHLLEGQLSGLTGRRDPEALEQLRALVVTIRATLSDIDLRISHHALKKKEAALELERFREKKTEYTRLAERQRAIDADIESLSKKRGQIAAQVAALALLEGEYQSLAKKLDGRDGKKQALDRMRKTRMEYDRLAAEARFALREISVLDTRAMKEREKLHALDTEASLLEGHRQRISELFHIGPDIPDEKIDQEVLSIEAGLNQKIGALSGKLAQLVNDRKTLVSDWNTLKKAGPDGICPLCHQTLGTHFGRIEEEFSSRLDQLQEEALHASSEEDRLNAEKERIQQQKPALHEIRGIVERRKARGGIETEIREIERQHTEKELLQRDLAEKIPALGFDPAQHADLEADLSEMERFQARFIEIGKQIAHLTALKGQVSDLDLQIGQKQGDLEQIRTLIGQTGFLNEEGVKFEQALAAIESALITCEAEKAGTAERLRHTESEIERLTREEKEIEDLKKRNAVLEEEISLLRLTRSLIGQYTIHLMQVVRSRIEGEVSHLISEITGGRYEQVLLDEDFNLLVRDIDNDFPVERFSGGEQDDIAVALRIALSRYLAELHQVHESTLLIFDEIFGSQDEERRTNLLSALRTQESRFPQIILISHIPDIQGEFTNTLMVEMGTDLSSSVREVS